MNSTNEGKLTFHNASEIDEDNIFDDDEEEDDEEEDNCYEDDEEEHDGSEHVNSKKRKVLSSNSCNSLVKKKKKKTKGRVKINMEFIQDKTRRYTTFSKRKTGIMKKAYELSTLTGTQVMLLVASETGHVYTFATDKLQPMITSDAGKSLIQSCLNSNLNEEENGADNNSTLPATNGENNL